MSNRFRVISMDGTSNNTAIQLIDAEGNVVASDMRIQKIELSCEGGGIWTGVFHVMLPKVDIIVDEKDVAFK